MFIRGATSAAMLMALGTATCSPVDAGAPAKAPAYRVERDIVFSQPDGQTLRLDAYEPAGVAAGAKLPAIVVIHGGAWAFGGRTDLAMAARAFAEAGFVAFCVDYRLANANGNKFPDQLDDVQTAVRWIRVNAARFHVDPERIGAFGHSAGGHLAALLGTLETRDNSNAALAGVSSRVEAVVDTSGPALLTGVPDSAIPAKVLNLLLNLFGKLPSQAPAMYALASPALHIDEKTASMLIVHGSNDSLVPVLQSETFYTMLKAKGRDATLLKLPGQGHVFVSQGAVKEWIGASLGFFEKHLQGAGKG